MNAPRSRVIRAARRRAASVLAAIGLAGGVVLSAGTLGTACSSPSTGGYLLYTDASAGLSVPPGETLVTGDAGQSLRSWPPSGTTCSNAEQCPGDPGAGAVYVTISGESNAISGYPFPPADWSQSTYFVDGWELIITEYIVVVDKVTLWSNPNRNLTNQGSLVGMSTVAHLDGPFVVDLHKGGSLTGQGGSPEQATPLGVIANQSDNGGAALDPTTTYGFGFSTVPATWDAYNVNLTSDESADFQTMVENGYSVFYRGHLTWNGAQSPYGCTVTNASTSADAGSDGSYDYAQMPNAGIDMAFGFSTPTNYVNCQNMSLPGMPNPGEDYPRGIQVSPSQSAIAQVTVHMDHPFWESFAENSPVHFDQIAAQYLNRQDPTAHTEDMKGVPFYAFTDSAGAPLPWRNCAGSFYTPPGNGQMSFDTLSVPIDPHGVCTGVPGADFSQDNCPGIRDYYDYLRFSQSTQGHLNSQGLCFIDRHYPAPAGGS
jgi:hypothetical protein